VRALVLGALVFLGPGRLLAAPAPVSFAVNRDYPPISFLELGVPKGVCVDLIKALSGVTGRPMPIRLVPWDQAQELVQNGEADALGLLAITEQRKALYDFTQPVLNSEYALFTRADRDDISGLGDLKGKSVGVIRGGFPSQVMLALPGVAVVPVTSYQDGMRRLLNGEFQAFAGDKWVALYHLHHEELAGIKMAGSPFAVRGAGFAVRKGDRALLDELNRGLAELKRLGTIESIMQKWSGKQMVLLTREKLRRALTLSLAGMGLITVTLLGAWIATLKRQIAERKRVEQQLRASEERYRILVEKAPDAILVYDMDLRRIVDANERAERLFGLKRAELVGSPVERLMVEAQPDGLSLEESTTWYQNRASLGEEVSIERVVRHASGCEVLCAVLLVALPDVGRRLLRASYLDITARREAELSQRRSEQRFRDLYQNAPFGIYQSAVDGRFFGANPTLARLFGYQLPEEMVAQTRDVPSQLFVYPQQRQALIEEALKQEGFVNREVLYKRRDGSHFDAILHMRAVRNPLGEVEYLEGFVEDVTLRQQALAELNKLSQAIMQSPASVAITDTAGMVEFVNPKFSQLTGYSAREVLGRHLRFLQSGQDSRDVYLDLWETVSAGLVWEGELQGRRQNGELFWTRVTASPVRGPEGGITHYLLINEDITDQRSMKEQLFQSQKMEAVGQLAGGIAHDFNNILTVIMGYANLLRLTPGFDAESAHKVDAILAASEKAAQLNRALLTFSRKQIMDPRPADLNVIVHEVRSFLERIIGEDVRLKLVQNAAPIRVKVDRGQIEQVLMNLATNARDAMPRGGLLVIETDLQLVEPPAGVAGRGPGPGRYAVLTISDTGIGMDQATVSRIFEPFFTTKEVGKGTGLGMAIVHGVVNQHNGFVNVYSEPGQGTSFRIFLPLCEEQGAKAEVAPAAEPVLGGDETILVAEDDAAVGTLVCQVLTDHGYRVLLAADGNQAVTLFREHCDGIDLVVMDMVMPHKSGWEAVQEIAGIKAGVRVLFTSGYTRDFIKNRGELDEGIELVLKPVQPLELLRKVRSMLDA